MEVFVDKGMREGHTVTFNGEADQEFGKDPGDVQIGNALHLFALIRPYCPVRGTLDWFNSVLKFLLRKITRFISVVELI